MISKGMVSRDDEREHDGPLREVNFQLWYGVETGSRETQLSGTQLDNTMTRYDYWEVLSPPYLHFDREFL